jgi:Rrf2 family iron-sulfur cluster assembly transcriptional regulator
MHRARPQSSLRGAFLEISRPMRLGTKGRYAVMAMADLARHGRDRAVSLAEIANRQEISLAYLEQLFAALRRQGLVQSVRGPGGGYRLARGSSAINVAEVVLAVDEPLTATRCEGKTVGCLGGGERCATHELWDALGGHIEHFLAGVSLEDVIERRVKPPQSPAPAEAA